MYCFFNEYHVILGGSRVPPPPVWVGSQHQNHILEHVFETIYQQDAYLGERFVEVLMRGKNPLTRFFLRGLMAVAGSTDDKIAR